MGEAVGVGAEKATVALGEGEGVSDPVTAAGVGVGVPVADVGGSEVQETTRRAVARSGVKRDNISL